VKTGYHLFFGHSPLNFWSNLTPAIIRQAIREVRRLGFGSAFIIVPWGEFVTGHADALDIQDYCASAYRLIVEECRAAGLPLHVRVGYLWEPWSDGATTYARYTDFFSDPAHERSLEYLCRFLRDTAQDQGADVHHFFSWEDLYWPIFSQWPRFDADRRAALGAASGYGDYLALLGEAGDEGVAIPAAMSGQSLHFCAFYDTVLVTRILAVAARAFGSIGYEYRSDSDHIGHDDPYNRYYHWARCHPHVSQKYVYFHPAIFNWSDGSLSPEQGVERLRWSMRTAAPKQEIDERPLVMDQFNFVDDTETSWARIAPDAIDAFLHLAAQEAKQRDCSMVLWSIVEWPRDVVFNGSFVLGLRGWTLEGGMPQPDAGARLDEGVRLTPGCALTQQTRLSFPVEEGFFVALEFDVLTPAASIRIDVGAESRALEVEAGFCVSRQVRMSAYGGRVTIHCDGGEVQILKVMVYDRYYSQGGTRVDGSRRDTLDSFLRHFHAGAAG
jgi:hypothetical protein